jgi:AcrR family transcriptional regulator
MGHTEIGVTMNVYGHLFEGSSASSPPNSTTCSSASGRWSYHLTELQQCWSIQTVSELVGPRARRRQATIDEVLAGARDLAREHGLASVSMRELGTRVGLHASSLYQYFPSKDAIYDALFAQGHRELLAWMAGRDRNGNPVEVLKKGSRRFTEFCLEDEVRYQLLFQRTIPGFVPSAASMDLAWQSYRDMVAALAAAGVTDQADVDLWTAIQMGLTEQQWANDPSGRRFVDHLEPAVDMFLAHVKRTRRKARP